MKADFSVSNSEKAEWKEKALLQHKENQWTCDIFLRKKSFGNHLYWKLLDRLNAKITATPK